MNFESLWGPSVHVACVLSWNVQIPVEYWKFVDKVFPNTFMSHTNTQAHKHTNTLSQQIQMKTSHIPKITVRNR